MFKAFGSFWMVVMVFAALPALASPHATEVVGYMAGTNPQAGYTDPHTALGAPERVTGEGMFGGIYAGDVTVFNSAWGSDEVVSIGAGGYLTLGFDHPVANAPSNPFGIDLIVFGNAFFTDPSLWDPTADPGVTGISDEPARIRVSPDNVHWYDVPFTLGDSLFPTQGFMDTGGPFGYDGTVASDFQKPVDPAIDWLGKTYEQILALYDGSGGGTGVDLDDAVDVYGNSADLDAVQYVMLYIPNGDSWSAEIDAVSDVAAVPLPAAAWLLGSGFVAMLGFRRKACS